MRNYTITQEDKNNFIKEIEKSEFLSNDEKNKIFEYLNKTESILSLCAIKGIISNSIITCLNFNKEKEKECKEWIAKMHNLLSKICKF